MSIPRKKMVNCSKCGHPISATVFETVNTDYAQNIAAQIMSGELFNLECPKCKTVSHLEYDLLYHDMLHGAMIWVVHKCNSEYNSKIEEVRSTITIPYKTLRIVEDMNALKEKVSCLEKGRDDRIIEACKVFVLGNLISQQRDFAFRNAFYTILSGQELIYFYDVDGNYQCWEVSDDLYDYLKELYFNSPYAEQFDGNYPIVDLNWAKEIMMPLMEAEADRIDTNNAATEDHFCPEEKEEYLTCPECNNALPPDSKFCQYCGHKIKTAVAANAQNPTSQAVNTEPIVSAAKAKQMNYEMDADYGLVPIKPIRTRNVEEQRLLLQALHSIKGECITWNRRGAFNVAGLTGVVEVFDGYLPSGEEYKTIYLCVDGGGSKSTIVPKGFSYVEVSNMPATTKKKTGKKALIWAISVVVIAVVVTVCFLFVIPEVKYQQACDELEKGSLTSAMELFEELNGYKDSNEMILEVKYQQACDKLKNGALTAAMELFEELDVYKDSDEMVLESKYRYVLRHRNNDELTTYNYLKELKREDYKDSSDIYDELYAWEAQVFAVNTNETSRNDMDSISRADPIYFHVKISGGEPRASVRIHVKTTFPDGESSEYIFDNEYSDGDSCWYGWAEGIYMYPEYGTTGTLQCKFYDDDGNLIGKRSVRITN